MSKLANVGQVYLDDTDHLVVGPTPIANPEGDGISDETLHDLRALENDDVITIQNEITDQTVAAFFGSKREFVMKKEGPKGPKPIMVQRDGFEVEHSVVDIPPRLLFGVRKGDGLDESPPVECARHGMIVDHSPTNNSEAVAEMMTGHYLHLKLNLGPNKLSFAEHHCPMKDKALNPEGSKDKNYVIVGMGNIGRLLYRNLQVLAPGANFFFVDNPVPEDSVDGCKKISNLHNILPDTDWIFVSASRKTGDPYILGDEEFSLLKPTAKVINGSRGNNVKEPALATHVYGGGGAGIDVQEDETPTRAKLDFVTRFDAHPRVCITGHKASKNPDAVQLNGEVSARKMMDFITRGAVNVDPEGRSNCCIYPRLDKELRHPGLRVVTSHADVDGIYKSFGTATNGIGVGPFSNSETTEPIYAVGESIASGVVEKGDSLPGSLQVTSESNRNGIVTVWDLKNVDERTAEGEIRNLLALQGGICRMWIMKIVETS